MVERTLTAIPQESVHWTIPEDFKGIMNYNPRHDIQDYLDLANLNGKIPPEEYAQLLIQTNTRIRRQLEKAIGERFGVERSTIGYFIYTDGKLHNPDYPQPIVERYKKGKRFLAENGSTETERESAEVEGIKHIERIFTDQDFPQNQTVIMVSPQGPEGSLYTDNIFHIFQKSDDRITMTRYYSTHPLEGFLAAAQKIDPTYREPSGDQELNDAYFLQRPIKSKRELPEILEIFALDKTAQKIEVNQEIIETCTPYFPAYIKTLIENPLDIEKIKLTLNAIYHTADQTDEKIKERQGREAKSYLATTSTRIIPVADIDQEINFRGRQPVRTVNRGCPGGQKGFNVSQSSFLRQLGKIIGAKSVLDFAPFADDEDEDTSDFPCGGIMPDGSPCTYIVSYRSGIRKCPKCGNEATCG